MDTKTALLISAENAVRTRGYDGFSYADLANVVGIRKASIHYHFPSKGDLAVALIERYRSDMCRSLAEFKEQSVTAGEMLDKLVRHYRDSLNDGQQLCLCVAFAVSSDNLGDEVVRQIEGFRNDIVIWLASVFKLGKDDGSIARVVAPEQEANACLATLEGAHLAARTVGDVRRFDASLAALRTRIS